MEGTAGNTGIGLTMVAKALGYRTAIVIPETQSQEKKDALRLLGAELIEVPAVPYRNPNNYVRLSGRLAEQLAKTEPNGAIWANQFDNPVNRQAHIETTAQEIWRDTNGQIDGFVAAVGSGGTLAGTAIGLKERDRNIKIALADPHGAALHAFYTTGELKAEGDLITEGIGQGRFTANLEGFTLIFLPNSRCGGARYPVCPRGRGGALPRRLVRHQHCRCNPACKRSRAGPHNCDRAL